MLQMLQQQVIGMENKQIINSFIKEIQENVVIYDVLTRALQIYNLSKNIFLIDAPEIAMDYFLRISLKYTGQETYHQIKKKQKWLWGHHEYTLFCWTAVLFASLQNKTIQQFNSEQIAFIHKMFYHQEPSLIQYSLLDLVKEQKRKPWEPQEQRLLFSIIIEDQMIGKWTSISYSLFKMSNNRFYRSSKKSREHWFNHTNPQVSKDKWTEEEDSYLMSLVKKMGTKWSRISKEMNEKRNQHMVKNRYRLLMKNSNDKNTIIQDTKKTKKILKIQKKTKHLAKLQQKNEKDSQKQESKSSKIEEEEQNYSIGLQNPIESNIQRYLSFNSFEQENEDYFALDQQYTQSNGFSLKIKIPTLEQLILYNYL